MRRWSLALMLGGFVLLAAFEMSRDSPPLGQLIWALALGSLAVAVMLSLAPRRASSSGTPVAANAMDTSESAGTSWPREGLRAAVVGGGVVAAIAPWLLLIPILTLLSPPQTGIFPAISYTQVYLGMSLGFLAALAGLGLIAFHRRLGAFLDRHFDIRSVALIWVVALINFLSGVWFVIVFGGILGGF